MAISGLDSRDGGKESLLLSPHLPIPPSPTTQSRASPRTKIPSSGQYFLETVTTTPCLLYGNREKSLHHVAMVAKFLDLNQSGYCKYSRKKTCTTFLCMIALKNKTAVHTFLPSFNNANGRLCQEGLLGSRNFATMVT